MDIQHKVPTFTFVLCKLTPHHYWKEEKRENMQNHLKCYQNCFGFLVHFLCHFLFFLHLSLLLWHSIATTGVLKLQQSYKKYEIWDFFSKPMTLSLSKASQWDCYTTIQPLASLETQTFSLSFSIWRMYWVCSFTGENSGKEFLLINYGLLRNGILLVN